MGNERRGHAVVPAAGIGRRMGASRPKQYLDLAGRTVLQHTLERLARHPLIEQVWVSVREDDPYWPRVEAALDFSPRRCTGGEERCDSVLNALRTLREEADGDCLVLVHDAVRPCLRGEDLDALFEQGRRHPIGAVLGTRVRDTMKRTGANRQITATVSREGLWHAFTPQLFRLDPLREALESARAEGVNVTDEAQAMERAGAAAVMVEGHADNLKITRPEDLDEARRILAARERA